MYNSNNCSSWSLTCHQYNEGEDADRFQLEAILRLLIQSGIVHNNHESVTNLCNIIDSLLIYHATMPLHCFRNLLKFLRFYDRQRRDKTDRLAPI
ncbi:unnamed protein product [Rotaria sp. Silwood2]|nr:unnamed protein product [Rotaria sp. Silwood2]CAF4266702.1 unnamed protein product [Rotaria sp. Silwood2]